MKLLYPAEIVEIYSVDKRVISMCQASTTYHAAIKNTIAQTLQLIQPHS